MSQQIIYTHTGEDISAIILEKFNMGWAFISAEIGNLSSTPPDAPPEGEVAVVLVYEVR